MTCAQFREGESEAANSIAWMQLAQKKGYKIIERPIEERVREYLIDNILGLYEIGEVKFYTLVTGNAAENKIESLGELQGIEARPAVETVNGQTLSEAELQNKKYILKN